VADLLGEPASVLPLQSLYRCLDKVLLHKQALFIWLRDQWESLFGVQFDVLLYDLTVTVHIPRNILTRRAGQKGCSVRP
jgi:hypothetical protein